MRIASYLLVRLFLAGAASVTAMPTLMLILFHMGYETQARQVAMLFFHILRAGQ